MHVRVYAGAHVCAVYVQARGQPSPWYFQESVSGLELCDKAGKAWTSCTWVSLPPPQCLDDNCIPPHLTIFTWVLGAKLRSTWL